MATGLIEISKEDIIAPVVGEIRKFKKKNGRGNYRKQWVICPMCNTGRWVNLIAAIRANYTELCHACNSFQHGGKRIRKNGTYRNSNGYVMILLQPDDFFYSMVGADSYVLEHRLVMAKHLGRSLHSWEIVHHINHIRDDNRLGNLQLVSDDKHKQISVLENKISRLNKENVGLKTELRILKLENKKYIKLLGIRVNCQNSTKQGQIVDF